MKKPNKHKPKTKIVKELAGHFEADFKASLPISIQPNGSVVYKRYIIKENALGNWALHYLNNKDLIEQFYLKTCALMAAKAYEKNDIMQFKTIKQLDNRYWANHSESIVYKTNMKKTTEFERFLILLNKFEYSDSRATYFKDEISKMFKWSFV